MALIDLSDVSTILENPVHGTISMNLTLQEASSVELDLYDLAGHLVAQRSKCTLSPGRHALQWNLDQYDLPGGAYLMYLTTDNGTGTHRILLMD